MIGFRDGDDDEPRQSRLLDQSGDEDESFDLVPEPKSASRVPGDRGSKFGQSRDGLSRSGSTIAAGLRSDVLLDRASHSSHRARPPLDDSANRDDFSDILDVKEDAPALEDDDDSFHFAIPVLPEVITHSLLPWAMIAGGLGWAGYLAVMSVLGLPGHAVGLSMVGAALLLYAALVVPLTLKSIHSAAITAELRLPNVVGFQTFALLALPTAGMVVGYCAGGTGPMITLGIFGLVVMCLLMPFMFRADVMQTVVTAFYAAPAYAASTALGVAILIGVGFILGKSGFAVPWEPEPVTVAQTDKSTDETAPPPPAAVAVAPQVVAPKPVEAPVIAQAAPKPVVPAGPPWLVPTESLSSAAAWPMAQKEILESIEVVTPVVTAHATAGGPFVAILQPRTTAIYDLRTGRRTGFIKAAFNLRDLVLSPDGSLLAGVETTESQNGQVFQDQADSGVIEVWSTADSQMLGKVRGGSANPVPNVPKPLGFASGKLLTYGSSGPASGLQVWDPATASTVYQWSTPPLTRACVAISNSGRFVAVTTNPLIGNSAISVFDVQSGVLAGELASPLSVSQMKGMDFSPDGKTLAAIVPGNSGAATLLEWNVADQGKLIRTVPMDMTNTVAPFDPSVPNGASMATATAPSDSSYFQWAPDGRTLRAGNALFEVTSGKQVFAVPAETSGNLSGALIGVANNRAVEEFLPTGTGSRLVLKTFDLPAATIESAIVAFAASGASTQPAMSGVATVPGAGWSPAGLPAADAHAPQINAMMASSSSASAGHLPAHATVQLALQGQWNVQVKSVTRSDPVAIQKDLAAQNAAITQIQNNLQDAVMKMDQVSHYREGVDGNGEIIRGYYYSDAIRTNAHSAVTDLQDELRQAKTNVIKLQHAAVAAPNARTVLAALENGIPVQITTESDAAAALVDAMRPGDRVLVSGLGSVSEGVLMVKLRSAVPSTMDALP